MFRPLVRILKYASIFAISYFIYIACFDLAKGLFDKSSSDAEDSKGGNNVFNQKLDELVSRIDRAVRNSKDLKESAEKLESSIELDRSDRLKLTEKPPLKPDIPRPDQQQQINPKIINNNNDKINFQPESDADFNKVLPEVQKKLKSSIVPVLVIACNRETVSQALDKLIQSRKSVDDEVLKVPIVVSQDNCNHSGTTRVIQSYVKNYPDIHFIQHRNDSDPAPELNAKSKKWQIGYYKLSRHYKFALDQVFYKVFAGQTIDATIIVEDDLEVSPDFFSYMLAGYEHMLVEEAIGHKDQFLCVSAWNDNGKPQNVDNSKAGLLKAHLTDFFPGLGWLIRKHVWEEFRTIWPRAYWDDWVRLPDQRKNRACIQPEISRSHTFGKKGVSNGQFFEKHLKFIKLADSDDIGIEEWRQALQPLVNKPVYNKFIKIEIFILSQSIDY